MSTAATNPPPPSRRRKLRVLVITMGSKRQEQITAMFSHPSMVRHFDPPAFSPGVPSRYLRNRLNLLRCANEAGVLPPEEWAAIGTKGVELYAVHPDTVFDCLDDVPVAVGRHGSQKDRALHYSVELWRKAKGLNRDRSVLGCFFAHLIAMRKLVEEGYDMIVEDNVRVPVGRPGGGDANDPETEDGTGNSSSAYCECANRVWQTIDASDALAASAEGPCHLRYYGWLSSRRNLEWVANVHAKRTQYRPSEPSGVETFDGTIDGGSASVFPFPLQAEFNKDFPPEERKGPGGAATCRDKDKEGKEKADDDEEGGDGATRVKSSGTPIWGAYAYWISRTGLETLLSDLRRDVGSIVWKGRRARAYSVKPIDKVVPRRITNALGRDCIHVTTAPAFFRAPMLTSTIHAHWDAEFCRSTEYQMGQQRLFGATTTEGSGGGISWEDLWLTEEEREVLRYKESTGVWLTLSQLSNMKDDEAKKAVCELREKMEECAKVDDRTEGIQQKQVCA